MSRKRITSVTRLAMGGPCLSAQKKAARITCCLSCTVGALALPCHASPGPAGPCLASPQIADTPPLHRWCPCQARPGPALPRLASPRLELSNLYFLGDASRPINQCLPIVRDFAASCVGDFICRCPRCSAVLVDGCCDPPLVIC